MRTAAGLLSLCACNQVFDLTPTSLPPADAAPRCPDSGPPPFSNRLVQAATQPCDNYSYSTVTHRALAMCSYEAAPYRRLAEGPVDGMLDEVPIVSPSGLRLDYPRISSDGSEAWFLAQDTATFKFTFSVFRRQRDSVWTWSHDVDLSAGKEAVIVGRFDTSEGKRLLLQIGPGGNPSTLEERTDDGSGTWNTVLRTASFDALGVAYFDVLGVSPDGLRLVFAGEIGSTRGMFYADRPDASSDFSPAVPLDNVPAASSVYYLDADCSRLYFSAIGSVFYAVP
ncbi:MAG TPA: hypothetical protein VLB44_04655 [Kofleriaceae bacterium]|nr:hypothetical protein [Kofleriaceae bacterium]